MANFAHSAVSGNNWRRRELIAFNIQVIPEDVPTFFNQAALPELISVSPAILDNEKEPHKPDSPLSKADIDFFAYMEDAMEIHPDQESFVGDFVAFVLKMMEYDEGHRVIHSRNEMKFEMYGEQVNAKSDICLMERTSSRGPSYLLLVQEDKRHMSRDDPESQLIAEGIAAFSDMNAIHRAAGMPLLDCKMIAGFTMVRTAPTFYKMHLTEELIMSIATGQYPSTPTIVENFVPVVREPFSLARNGMRPLDNRRIILQCFEAFKKIIVSTNFN